MVKDHQHQGVPQALIKSLKIETMVYKTNLAIKIKVPTKGKE
jgi:hypothetical protein